MSSCQPVAGVWSRLFEEDPLGDTQSADRTTLVLWTQTPVSGIYVDLRLPKDSPGRSDTVGVTRTARPSALRAITGGLDGTNADVSILTRQKSFAGVLTYSLGDTTEAKGEALAKDTVLAELAKNDKAALGLCTCFWRRDIDYQPPSGGLDIGVCASYSPMADNGAVDLRETGDDGSYAEGWHRVGETHAGPFMALQLVSENGHDNGRIGYWVRTGHRFAYAIGRPTTAELAKALGCPPQTPTIKDQVGKTLEEVIKSLEQGDNGGNKKEELLGVIGSYVAACGEIDPDTGAWRILDSTNPGLVHCHLVGAIMDKNCCSTLSKGDSKDAVKEGDSVQQHVCGEGSFVRKWKVLELSGCSVPFL
ncbi:expressed unknown protein [Seminavis robusta]|uniref:Uncharacterized protein n=1 Tax=Seminavis robusta TaxID=568900 RepID=A0A9N8E8B9_9STRA|nr:expressed unknown protein [Seminavis robusta]|eukprot:Sro656_g182420.1 n/a (363) ;mRNA; f:34696-35784